MEKLWTSECMPNYKEVWEALVPPYKNFVRVILENLNLISWYTILIDPEVLTTLIKFKKELVQKDNVNIESHVYNHYIKESSFADLFSPFNSLVFRK